MAINLKKGDLIKEIHEGKHDYVIHCVDCTNHWYEKDSLSAALAKQYNLDRFAFNDIKGLNPKTNTGLLGNVAVTQYFLAHVDHNIVFFTCYTTINEKAKDPEYNSVSYEALATCLYKVKLYLGSRKRVSMGKLALGGQKGDKDKIMKFIQNYLSGFDVEIIVNQ